VSETGPAGPCGPCGPAGPCGPVAAAGPCAPAGPCCPAGPCGPSAPSWPAGPAGPCVPGAPAGPAAPAGPRGPVAPAGPCGPGEPTGPCGPGGPVGADCCPSAAASASSDRFPRQRRPCCTFRSPRFSGDPACTHTRRVVRFAAGSAAAPETMSAEQTATNMANTMGNRRCRLRIGRLCPAGFRIHVALLDSSPVRAAAAKPLCIRPDRGRLE
jgi:hypothetical protein